MCKNKETVLREQKGVEMRESSGKGRIAVTTGLKRKGWAGLALVLLLPVCSAWGATPATPGPQAVSNESYTLTLIAKPDVTAICRGKQVTFTASLRCNDPDGAANSEKVIIDVVKGSGSSVTNNGSVSTPITGIEHGEGKIAVTAKSGDGKFSISRSIDVISVVVESGATNCFKAAQSKLKIEQTVSYSPAGYDWSSTPAGLDYDSNSNALFTYYPSNSVPGIYKIKTKSKSLESCFSEATIIIIKVSMHLTQTQACDGEAVEVNLHVTPASSKNLVTNILFTATKPNGEVDFENPSGQGITFSQRNADIFEWQIDNTRLYSTQANHCNTASDYKIIATCEVPCATVTCETDPVTFTASTTRACIDGEARPTQYFSGDIVIQTTQISENLWHATIVPGSFQRDIQAVARWKVPANSQYYSMVMDEEIYHRDSQLQNPSHSILQDYWLATNVLAATTAQEPFTGKTEQDARNSAFDKFEEQVITEEQRSIRAVFSYPGTIRCALETEAKQAVGASHRFAMPCAYPRCQ